MVRIRILVVLLHILMLGIILHGEHVHLLVVQVANLDQYGVREMMELL